jgi:uncharacterized protein (TIGR02598 family)
VNLLSHSAKSFSLVELTLALGVAAFCLIAVFALLPVGGQIHRNGISQTASAGILAAVTADLRATPKTALTSRQFGITFGSPTTLYFDSEGRPSTAAISRYRLAADFPTNPTGTHAAVFAHLKVSWPATVDPATGKPAGSVESFAAFDRH